MTKPLKTKAKLYWKPHLERWELIAPTRNGWVIDTTYWSRTGWSNAVSYLNFLWGLEP